MRLNLSLNGVLVASAALDPARCNDIYYLQAMRSVLLQQNRDILELIPAKPMYYIEVPARSAAALFANGTEQFVIVKNAERPVNDFKNYKACSNLGNRNKFSNN